MTTKLPRRTVNPRSAEHVPPGARVVAPGPDAAPDIDEPLPDPMFQIPHFIETLDILRTHFVEHPSALVYGNSPIYYEDQGRTRWVLPDCYVALGVDREAILRRNGYFIREVGRSPDFALEIASISTFQTDLGPKRELYARLGIGEYWRFDATGGDHYGEPLVGEALDGGQYRRIEINRGADGVVWGHSPVLGLDLCWVDEKLRFFDPADGTYLLNLSEERAARQAAELRANATRQSAEVELEQLREQIRRLQE